MASLGTTDCFEWLRSRSEPLRTTFLVIGNANGGDYPPLDSPSLLPLEVLITVLTINHGTWRKVRPIGLLATDHFGVYLSKLWVRIRRDHASSESETSPIPNQKCALDSVLDPPCPIRNKPDAFPMISVVKKKIFLLVFVSIFFTAAIRLLLSDAMSSP